MKREIFESNNIGLKSILLSKINEIPEDKLRAYRLSGLSEEHTRKNSHSISKNLSFCCSKIACDWAAPWSNFNNWSNRGSNDDFEFDSKN